MIFIKNILTCLSHEDHRNHHSQSCSLLYIMYCLAFLQCDHSASLPSAPSMFVTTNPLKIRYNIYAGAAPVLTGSFINTAGSGRSQHSWMFERIEATTLIYWRFLFSVMHSVQKHKHFHFIISDRSFMNERHNKTLHTYDVTKWDKDAVWFFGPTFPIKE